MEQYFAYGDRETDYLRQRDSKLAEAIERLGRPRRRVMPDLFQALTWSILGQQISTKACEAVWSRMLAGLGEVTPGRVMEESVASLQKFGTSFRKAGYIHSIAEQIVTGAFDLDALREMDDAEVCERLCTLPGVGVWTAEMIMLHSMQRPDIVSYGDLAIRRGMCRVYHHRKLTREMFERHRRRRNSQILIAPV